MGSTLAGVPGSPGSRIDRLVGTWQFPALLGVLAVLPIATAVGRAWSGHWTPVGDNAFIAIRSHDVLSAHPPLIGSPSSASVTSGVTHHHPGPLLFDVLAVPVHLFGGRGIPLAMGLVNAAAVVGAIVVAHRLRRPLLAGLAALHAALLSSAMGSEMLVEPWQPHAMLLPFLCFLFLVWGASCGEARLLPWAAGVGSFVLATHLSYSLLVPALGCWALVGLFAARRRGPGGTGSGPATEVRGAVVAAVLVLVVLWAQPVMEQLGSDGSGNLGNLVMAAGDDEQSTGLALGARVAGTVLGPQPWWTRSSFDAWRAAAGEPVRVPEELTSTGPAVASLAGIGVLLGVAEWSARRRGDLPAGRACAGALVALAMGVVSASVVPIGVLGILVHLFRWLWPIVAFAGFAVAATLLGALPSGRARRAGLVGLVALTAVVAALNVPAGPPSLSNSTPEQMRAARELNQGLDGFEDLGPVLVRPPPVFNDPYGPAVMAELARRDIPFVVDGVLEGHVGSARRANRPDVGAVLSFGTDPGPVPRGADVLARADGVALYRTMASD